MNKSRIYPKAKIDNNGDRPRGDICKLCDRKFLIRVMLLEAQSLAAKNTNKARRLEEDIAEANAANRLLNSMKTIRDKMHRAKVKAEKQKVD